jgi:hypothetical protein
LATERAQLFRRPARDTAIVIVSVGVACALFRDNPADLRARDEQSREAIRRIYRGAQGEEVVAVNIVGNGEFDVQRRSRGGDDVHFRVIRSGSNLVPADDESRRRAWPQLAQPASAQ